MNIILYGPTLSGKSAIAERFAQKNGFKIVNFDAYQIYKEIPIITASDDVLLSRYYSVYDEPYSVGKFVESVQKLDSNRKYIFVGGTAMYANVLLNGIHDLPSVSQDNIDLATEMFYKGKIPNEQFVKDFQNPHRVIRDYSFFLETGYHLSEFYPIASKTKLLKDVVFVSVENTSFDVDKIGQRIDNMIQAGMIDEVRNLNWPLLNTTSRKTLGLNDVHKFISNELSLAEMKLNMIASTKKLIKKQKVWQRGVLKSNTKISLDDFYDMNFHDERLGLII